MGRTWDVYIADVHRQAAARAAKEANRSTAEIARLNGVTTRTAQRWCRPDSAKGSPLDNGAPFECSKPERKRAFERVTKLMPDLRGLSREHLMRRYRETFLVPDPLDEARVELDPEIGWLDGAAYDERMSALHDVRAACRRRFAELGITRAEVQAEAFGR